MIQKTTHIAILTLLSASQLPAALVAYEPFNYTAIANGTATTGSGFTGNWATAQAGLAITTNLTYTDLPTEGSATRGAGVARASVALANPITSNTVYSSFLFKGNGNSGGVTNGLVLTGSSKNLFIGFGAGISATDTGFGLGEIGPSVNFEFATGFAQAGAISNTATHFVVLAMNLEDNSTSLWLNPTVNDVANNNLGAANLVYALDFGNLTGIGYSADGVLPTIDEVRIGTSWASVSGIPEPASAGLVGLAGLTLLLRRRQTTR